MFRQKVSQQQNKHSKRETEVESSETAALSSRRKHLPRAKGPKSNRGAVSWSIARVYQEATTSSSYSPYFSVYPYNELYERSQLEWFWFSPLAAVWLTQWYSHCLKGDQISESRGKIDVEINKYTSVCQFQDRSMLGVQQSLGDYL